MIIASAVVAFLLLICFIRFGLIAVYGENGFELRVSIGPFKRRIFPTDKTRKKDGGKKKEQKAESAEKAGKLEILKNQLPSIKQALSRLRRRLLIKELTIHYMAAGDDPAAAALYFGAASAGYGMIIPLLENNFNIKKRDLRTTVNFDANQPYIYVKAVISIAVWEAVYAGFGVVRNMIKSENARAKIRKAV